MEEARRGLKPFTEEELKHRGRNRHKAQAAASSSSSSSSSAPSASPSPSSPSAAASSSVGMSVDRSPSTLGTSTGAVPLEVDSLEDMEEKKRRETEEAAVKARVQQEKEKAALAKVQYPDFPLFVACAMEQIQQHKNAASGMITPKILQRILDFTQKVGFFCFL